MLFSSSLRWFPVLLLLTTPLLSLQAQRYQEAMDAFLRKEKSAWHLTDADISQYAISSQYDNLEIGVTYTYLNQEVADIRIFNAISTMAIRDGKVIHFANRFIPNAAKKANAVHPSLSAESAIEKAATHLGLSMAEPPGQPTEESGRKRYTYGKAGISRENIKAELVFVPAEEELLLAWNINITPVGTADGWNIRIDALTGEFIEKNNLTVYCNFTHHRSDHQSHERCSEVAESPIVINWSAADTARYNVFPYPAEAPSFGSRQILTNPHIEAASPFGWHDIDGIEGAEFTITRGNNVYAYEDLQDQNSPGYSPDGGATLNFDFAQNLNLPPTDNMDANLTNLFYANNWLHDVLYVHGFDEAAGNFQQTNYTGEGIGGDYVVAEGFDGGGTDNANFYTPDDGGNGRMQMYLWLTDAVTAMEITNPDSLVGFYNAVEATFGPGLDVVPIDGQVALVIDNDDPVHNACDSILNATELAGKIAVLDPGGCTYIKKAQAVEAAGAIAMIVINNTGAPPFAMGGSGVVNIPSVMISQADGEQIRSALINGDSVHVKLSFGQGAESQDKDGSLDNGVIAHEFGHGVSNRLTGGPFNSNCLEHAEQGGEGWSDWLALVTTIEPGDSGADKREIGTYSADNADGSGIRRFPYSTNMSINPQTYGDLASSNGVHARGEIWCSAIWEATWALIDAKGFDPDLMAGVGGNNIAIRLVLEGMKLQGCTPGYIDARDGILAADKLLYDGEHLCILWEAFAKRGMGAYADQGSPSSVGDETEDFSFPNICLTATVEPVAKFAVDNMVDCYGVFTFDDQSENIPQYYQWDFGDGNTSEEENPMHPYSEPGTYTVTLIVTNNIGSDTTSLDITYGLPPEPVISGNKVVCEGSQLVLAADVLEGNTAIWSVADEVVHEGSTFTTPVLTTGTTYAVIQAGSSEVEQVGAFNNLIGGGNIHNTGFEGKLLFETFTPMTLQSVVLYAQGAAERTITLYDENDQVVDVRTIMVENGQSRVELNFEILTPGEYSIGNVSQNLYRNDEGADYPYTVDNLMTIYSSNATGDALSYYYYFYNWEVREIPCKSLPIEVEVVVEPGPVAGFIYDAADLTANFTDISAGDATTWAWDFGDGQSSTDQHTQHTYDTTGTYTVTLTVSNGSCFSYYTQVIEIGTTTTVDIAGKYEIQLHPNPASEKVTLRFGQPNEDQWTLRVFDASGRLQASQRIPSLTTSFDVNTVHFPPGTYQFQLISKEGMATKRITIMH